MERGNGAKLGEGKRQNGKGAKPEQSGTMGLMVIQLEEAWEAW